MGPLLRVLLPDLAVYIGTLFGSFAALLFFLHASFLAPYPWRLLAAIALAILIFVSAAYRHVLAALQRNSLSFDEATMAAIGAVVIVWGTIWTLYPTT